MQQLDQLRGALARRNISGCRLKELFRKQGSVGEVSAREIVPKEGIKALMPNARPRHDRLCQTSLQAPMDIHRRQTSGMGDMISGHS
jgi:hypothetical protein